MCKKANVPELRFHDLRHTFASQFVMNGGDLFVFAEVAWASQRHTKRKRYAHLSPDYLEKASGIVDFGPWNKKMMKQTSSFSTIQI